MPRDKSTAAKAKKAKPAKREQVSRRIQIASLCGGAAGAHDSTQKLLEALGDIRRRVDEMKEGLSEIELEAKNPTLDLFREIETIMKSFPIARDISKMRCNFWEMKYSIK